jgi:Flp pilus assembly secretin CpaC
MRAGAHCFAFLRRFAGIAGLAIVAASVSASAQERPELDQIAVSLDQAKLLKLPAGTETIIVGNPSIADVSIQRNNVIVITGRAPGRTNFIALDSNGTIISESMVSVSASVGHALVVQRGLDRSTYHCAPNCLPSVTLGDDEKHFNRSIDQSTKREATANQGNQRR